MNRKLGLGAIVGTVIASLVLAFAVTATPAVDAHTGHGASANKAVFHDAMRKLWEDHIVWTRQFIVSAATESGNLADIGPTTDRLLANQVDIGDALKPFCGDKAGDQVTALLRDHILTAARLVPPPRPATLRRSRPRRPPGIRTPTRSRPRSTASIPITGRWLR